MACKASGENRLIELLSFFPKSHFQLLVLKKHYDGDFKDFVDRLRMIYEFSDIYSNNHFFAVDITPSLLVLLKSFTGTSGIIISL